MKGSPSPAGPSGTSGKPGKQQTTQPKKPQLDRMREMHDTWARDREKAKSNPEYRFKTQQWWADYFELKSKKTIQRDCDYMRDRLRLPVYPIRERGGLGYTEDVGAFPLVSFSRGALVAICASWRPVGRSMAQSFRQTARSNSQLSTPAK